MAPLCACGCGWPVKRKIRSRQWNLYVNHHHVRDRVLDEDGRIRQATEEERREHENTQSTAGSRSRGDDHGPVGRASERSKVEPEVLDDPALRQALGGEALQPPVALDGAVTAHQLARRAGDAVARRSTASKTAFTG
jgi:hypothetical protein